MSSGDAYRVIIVIAMAITVEFLIADLFNWRSHVLVEGWYLGAGIFKRDLMFFGQL